MHHWHRGTDIWTHLCGPTPDCFHLLAPVFFTETLLWGPDPTLPSHHLMRSLVVTSLLGQLRSNDLRSSHLLVGLSKFASLSTSCLQETHLEGSPFIGLSLHPPGEINKHRCTCIPTVVLKPTSQRSWLMTFSLTFLWTIYPFASSAYDLGGNNFSLSPGVDPPDAGQ